MYLQVYTRNFEHGESVKLASVITNAFQDFVKSDPRHGFPELDNPDIAVSAQDPNTIVHGKGFLPSPTTAKAVTVIGLPDKIVTFYRASLESLLERHIRTILEDKVGFQVRLVG